MTNPPIKSAVQAICEEDDMPDGYRVRLMALIQNAMRDSIVDGDIDDLLNLIPVEEPGDED